MRPMLMLALLAFVTATASAADPTPKDLVAQLYQAHRSKHDPFIETRLLNQYLDAPLLKLYLRDRRQAKEEVGRLDGDPLYNAQDIAIKDFHISPAKESGGETLVTVQFANLGRLTRVVFVLSQTH